VIGVGVLLALLGVLSLIAIPKLLMRANLVWTEVPGTVTEAYIHQGERVYSHKNTKIKKTNSSPTYQVRIRYTYQVGGKSFTAETPSLKQPTDDEKRPEAAAIQQTIHPGDALKVYHHPSRPEESRFTAKEPPIEFRKDMFFGVGYLVIGLILLWLGWAALARRKRLAVQ
jgi:hypothetical protein